MAAEDDEDFEEKLAFTFGQMDANKTGQVNYMQLRKWIAEQVCTQTLHAHPRARTCLLHWPLG